MTSDEVIARVGWNLCTEPADLVAALVVNALGPVEAWDWLRAAREMEPVTAARHLTARAASGLIDPQRTARTLARAVERWVPRLGVDPRETIDAAVRIGAEPVVPGTPQWPTRVDDLGPAAPLCLWVRGRADLAAAVRRSVAVVGARAASEYGERVATELAADLAGAGVTVLSGGAYGIDAAAHHGALSTGEEGAGTVALLAGGPDRLAPAGNTDLLRRVIGSGGAVVAECPPGRPPSRSRFLLRNRLIAALTGVTVVVEAGWRSGALNTAKHADELLRPVGAIPGPVTSPASAGCHHLLRTGAAVCVTDAAEVLELLDPLTADRGSLRRRCSTEGDPVGAVVRDGESGRGPAGDRRDGSAGLTGEQRQGRGGPVGPTARGFEPPVGAHREAAPPHSRRARVLDALGRYPAGVRTLAVRAGLAIDEVEAELGLLDLAGLARRTAEGRWSLGGSAR